MTCPKCNEAQYCPCENCAKRSAGKVVWKWDDTGEIISCGHCGHTMSADDWMDHDMAQYNASRATPDDDPGYIEIDGGTPPISL